MKKPCRKWTSWDNKPISDTEHNTTFKNVNPMHRKWIEYLISDTNLFLRARQFKNKQIPRVYVFRSKSIWERCRGCVFYFEQKRKKSTELSIVFRPFYQKTPIPEEIACQLRRVMQA
jgi:hypothetical protein